MAEQAERRGEISNQRLFVRGQCEISLSAMVRPSHGVEIGESFGLFWEGHNFLRSRVKLLKGGAFDFNSRIAYFVALDEAQTHISGSIA